MESLIHPNPPTSPHPMLETAMASPDDIDDADGANKEE